MPDIQYPLIPLAHFTGRILRGEPCSISRWGDGEWSAVLGKKGANCDLHQYFPAMGEELRGVLRRRPKYAIGMQPLGYGMFKGEIEAWLAKEKLTDLPWMNADVFHIANHQTRLDPLIKALRRRPLVIVGPGRLRDLYSLFPYAAFIEVPMRDCYLQQDRILKEIRTILPALGVAPVVSFSASMAANVMIDKLYPEWGNKAFLMDFGSLWDPYVGAVTREYHAPILGECAARAGRAAPAARPKRVRTPILTHIPARRTSGNFFPPRRKRP